MPTRFSSQEEHDAAWDQTEADVAELTPEWTSLRAALRETAFCLDLRALPPCPCRRDRFRQGRALAPLRLWTGGRSAIFSVSIVPSLPQESSKTLRGKSVSNWVRLLFDMNKGRGFCELSVAAEQA
jgi:hypothetical protein